MIILFFLELVFLIITAKNDDKMYDKMWQCIDTYLEKN